MKAKPDVFDVLRDAEHARQIDLWFRATPPGLFDDAELIELLTPSTREELDAAVEQLHVELRAARVDA